MILRYFSNILFLTLCLSIFAFGDAVKNGSFQASSDGINVSLRWVTEDEANIAHFEIERRAGVEGNFVSIGTIDPKGASMYEFVDYSAFRKTTTIYQYRIKVTFTNGTAPLYIGPLTVNHTVSGVRRTWGSIKAMFR